MSTTFYHTNSGVTNPLVVDVVVCIIPKNKKYI